MQTNSTERIFQINPDLYPFESRWMDIEGIKVHYIDEGSGHPIVFFHGNPTWSVLYAPLIKRLKKSFRCIAIDYPGFGFSDTPSEDQYSFYPEEHSRISGLVLDNLLEDASFSVFVQDWGGPIGLDAACDRHEQVDRIYLGNTWAWAHDPATPEGQASKAFSEKMGSQRDRILNKNFFVKLSMKQLTMGYKRNAPELLEAIQDAYEKVHPSPASRVGMAVFPTRIMDSGPWLAALDRKLTTISERPAVIFWGEKDPLFTDVQLNQWQARLSNSRTVLLPEAGHFFQQDEPDIIAAEIRRGTE
jgi:haloalkane dehalogenase